MQRPIRPGWLLRQARELARGPGGPGAPRHADLRRAISSAYYAVFHATSMAVALELLSQLGEQEQYEFVRLVTHDSVSTVASWVHNPGSASPHARTLVGIAAADGRILEICSALSELREERDRADYDHFFDLNRPDTVSRVEQAENAVRELDEVQDTPGLQAFAAVVTLKSRIRR